MGAVYGRLNGENLLGSAAHCSCSLEKRESVLGGEGWGRKKGFAVESVR